MSSRTPEASGPTEHADFIIVALAYDVGARFNQQLDGCEVGDRRRNVERVGVVRKIAHPDVGAPFQQQPHARMLIAAGGSVQGGLLLESSAKRVDQLGMGVEPPTQGLRLALPCGIEDAVDRLHQLARARLASVQVADEKLDRLVAVRLGDLVNGAAVLIGRARIESGLEGAADRLDVACAGGAKDLPVLRPTAIESVDMGLECTPALEAVVSRDVELSVMELCSRIVRTQLLQPLLGGLLQPIDVGMGGKRLGHGTPSFFAPGDRNSRARKKEMSAQCWRRVRPFTRSVGRLFDHGKTNSAPRPKSNRHCRQRAGLSELSTR